MPAKVNPPKLVPMQYEEFIIEYNTEYRLDHSIRNAGQTPFEVAEKCEDKHMWHIEKVFAPPFHCKKPPPKSFVGKSDFRLRTVLCVRRRRGGWGAFRHVYPEAKASLTCPIARQSGGPEPPEH